MLTAVTDSGHFIQNEDPGLLAHPHRAFDNLAPFVARRLVVGVQRE